MKKHKQRLLLLLLSLLAASVHCFPVHAESPSFVLSVRVVWEDQTGEKAAERSQLLQVSDRWKREGDHFVYTGPLQAGDTVEFMQGIQIPPEWGNDRAGQPFTVKVEAVTTQCTDSMAGSCPRPVIEEYEKAGAGEEQPFVRGRTVLPGQKVSKIVRIRLVSQGVSASSTSWSGNVVNISTKTVISCPQDASSCSGIASASTVLSPEAARSRIPERLQSISVSSIISNLPGSARRAAETGDSADIHADFLHLLAGALVLIVWLFWRRKRNNARTT